MNNYKFQISNFRIQNSEFRISRCLSRRRGAIFITTLGITIILTSLVLVFAQSMRTEAIASANRLSYVQADAVEQGAEQWVMANIESTMRTSAGDAITVTQIPAQAIQVGSGYFFLLNPDPDSDQDYAYGITDEAGKLNLNYATADEIALLPNMTTDVADAIVDWRSDGTQPTDEGAESDYYESLSEPYDAKNAFYESIEELYLVKGLTADLLYGFDLNHDGVVDAAEQNVGGKSSLFNSGTTGGSRGIFNDVTVHSVPQTPASRTQPLGGWLNVNTASKEVLECFGISDSDADSIISARQSAPFTSKQAVQQAAGSSYSQPFGVAIGFTSYQYSADIVAVSGDGRAFKRVRIVVDAQPPTGSSASTSTLSRIIYRKDLTSLGWPLPKEIRDTLRSGGTLDVTSVGVNSGGMNP